MFALQTYDGRGIDGLDPHEKYIETWTIFVMLPKDCFSFNALTHFDKINVLTDI